VFASVILLLHNRYRVPGGEERAVADLAWLIRTELGEEAEVLERDSAVLGRGKAALGLLRGGLAPGDVAAAVRRTGARVVHAHNVQPSLGWRALVAAREAGARVVLHLHNYRLVCAVGTCFTRGEDCIRCHGRNTLPGVRLNCRGGSRAEAAAYGAGLALWQRRLAESADAFVVPSAFALRRLEQLGAPLGGRARVIPSVQREFAERSRAAGGEYALYAGRLTAEKGVADALAACRLAGVPLVVAGDGPDAAELRAAAGRPYEAPGPAAVGRPDEAPGPAAVGRPDEAPGPAAAGRPDEAPGPAAVGRPDEAPGPAAAGRPDEEPGPAAAARPDEPPAVRFTGHVGPAELAELRAGAALALVPSRYEEILPLAALEAMAAGLPVVASRAGGLAELVPERGLHPPGDVAAMAQRIRALWRDQAAGDGALAAARERTAAPVVAAALRELYS